MIKDLQLIRNINLLFNQPIVLYGNGSCGRTWLKKLREFSNQPIDIRAFVDSNKKTMGKWYVG